MLDHSNIIDINLLLLASEKRKRSNIIQVARAPVIHLPGPRWPSYCCQSCGHEYLSNRCQNCGRPHEDE